MLNQHRLTHCTWLHSYLRNLKIFIAVNHFNEWSNLNSESLHPYTHMFKLVWMNNWHKPPNTLHTQNVLDFIHIFRFSMKDINAVNLLNECQTMRFYICTSQKCEMSRHTGCIKFILKIVPGTNTDKFWMDVLPDHNTILFPIPES